MATTKDTITAITAGSTKTTIEPPLPSPFGADHNSCMRLRQGTHLASDQLRLLNKRANSLRQSMQQWGEAIDAFLGAERFAEVEEARVARELARRSVRRLPVG
ncbi:MAG: hypothetical protein R8K47_02390, partial [Mariprofundaceae bacterium]